MILDKAKNNFSSFSADDVHDMYLRDNSVDNDIKTDACNVRIDEQPKSDIYRYIMAEILIFNVDSIEDIHF